MKQRIVQTASQLFVKLGFKSTTMDDICNELGISKKTLYSYYKNKKQLVEGSVFHISSIIQKTVDNILQKKNNPILELYYAQEAFKDTDLYQSSSFFQLKKYYPDIYKKIVENHFKTFKTKIVENLERGISLGYFREDLDVNFIMRFYFSLLTEINEQSFAMKNLYRQEQIEFYILEYHIRAIATQKGIAFLENYLREKLEKK